MERYHNRQPLPRNNPGVGNLLLIPAGIILALFLPPPAVVIALLIIVLIWVLL